MQVQNQAGANIEKPTLLEKKTDSTTQRADQEIKSGQLKPSNAQKSQVSHTNGKDVASGVREETSAYLKVVSRLENLLEKGEASDKLIEGFRLAIKTRLEDLGEQDKKAIMFLKETQALGIEKIEDLPQKIAEGFNGEKTGYRPIFELLKNPAFAEMMDSKKETAKTYSPKTVANKAPSEPKAQESQGQKIPNTPMSDALDGEVSTAARVSHTAQTAGTRTPSLSSGTAAVSSGSSDSSEYSAANAS